jgi:hypothetical protein
MTIINRFFNLFQRKAVKDTPVVVMPAKIVDDKPVVKYVERVINANNVDAYRSGRAQFVGGDHVNGAKYVVVYRYVIDPDLHLDAQDQIIQDIEFMRATEADTIKHEAKHMQNDRFGNPLFVVTNYYEMTGLYAFDEVSAYATAYLKHDKPTHKEVCNAVSHGIDDLLERKSEYIPRHVNQVAGLIGFKFMAGDTESTLRHNWEPPKQYSQTFNAIAHGYLTFDGQGIRDENNVIPVELKEKLKHLRHEYEDATSQTLRMIMERFTRGQK